MRLVVYGPDRKLGAWEGDQVIDLNFAYAKYAREVENEPLPYEMASAIVPNELGLFIDSGPRAIEGAQKAVDYLSNRAADKKGIRGERLVESVDDVKLHAPYARRARIMMAGGNFIIHSQGMGRSGDGQRASLDDVLAESRKKGIWGFYCFPENAVGP